MTCETELFLPVMREMAKLAECRKLIFEFILVRCDGRITQTEDWQKYWERRAREEVLPILATVTGGKDTLPHLFPCLEHRFALYEATRNQKKLPRND
jgi:hypothetical protein